MVREEQRQAIEIIATLLDLIRARNAGVEPVNFGGPAGVASAIERALEWLDAPESDDSRRQLRNGYTASPKYPPLYKVHDRVIWSGGTGEVVGIIRPPNGLGYQCYVLLDHRFSGETLQLIHEDHLRRSL